MDENRIKKEIAKIARSPKNVRFESLANLLDNHIRHIFPGYNHPPGTGSHHAFTVGGRTFTVVKPNSGCVKRVYIDYFLDAMEELGLYDPEEDR